MHGGGVRDGNRSGTGAADLALRAGSASSIQARFRSLLIMGAMKYCFLFVQEEEKNIIQELHNCIEEYARNGIKVKDRCGGEMLGRSGGVGEVVWGEVPHNFPTPPPPPSISPPHLEWVTLTMEGRIPPSPSDPSASTSFNNLTKAVA
eukprot:gene25927-biopygen11869